MADFDIKEKIKELKKSGKDVPKNYFDLGVAFWLLNPDEGDYSPENLSKKFLRLALGPPEWLVQITRAASADD